MAVEIKVPSVGESIVEGNLARWLKKNGDFVQVDEPVFELETDKATTEIAAPASGKLEIIVPEGKTIAIGAVVGRISEEAKSGGRADKKPPSDDSKAKTRPDQADAVEKPAQKAPAAISAPAAEKSLSPAVRRIVEEQKVDVDKVEGSGRGGRVTKGDVLTFVEKHPSDAPATPAAKPKPTAEPAPKIAVSPAALPLEAAPRESRQRMSAIRQRIAERLVVAQNSAAILTTFNEADMTAVLELRSRYKESFQKKHDVGLGFLSFFVKACVEALRAFPAVNAAIDGHDIVYHNYYDIGVAVSTEKGLMVPILRGAENLSFAAVEKQISELAQKARAGKISVNDLQGGTFTITNGGVFGSLLSTPILNPPQSGILGMHTIQKRPVAINDQVVIRPMMYLALSYDHRLIDGREAVQFLVRVKECIESPERMLLEI